MSGGTSSIHTNKGLQEDLLANRWATQLPIRLVWWKEMLLKEHDKAWISFKMWPRSEESSAFSFMALMITSESPSTITLSNPSSLANKRALHATITSIVSTEVGRGIICERAAKTNLDWSRIIMPRPTELWVKKIAPLKLTFTTPGGLGLFLEFLCGLGRYDGTLAPSYEPALGFFQS